jgi:hypothetical protein
MLRSLPFLPYCATLGEDAMIKSSHLFPLSFPAFGHAGDYLYRAQSMTQSPQRTRMRPMAGPVLSPRTEVQNRNVSGRMNGGQQDA